MLDNWIGSAKTCPIKSLIIVKNTTKNIYNHFKNSKQIVGIGSIKFKISLFATTKNLGCFRETL